MSVFTLVLLVAVSLLTTLPAYSQAYSFSMDQEDVDIYLEADGSMILLYRMTFTNDAFGSPLDFFDIGMPTNSYNISQITASVNNIGISHIATSEYIDQGIELGLGANAIQAGRSATIVMQTGPISGILYEDTEGDEYASVRFLPNYFDSDFTHGQTDLILRFHLPPGVLPEEPRWHNPPNGWPEDVPASYLDNDQRVVYEWHNSNANPSTKYEFGASFPKQYVPAEAIVTPSLITLNEDAIFGFCCFGGVFAAILGFIGLGVYSSRRRKLNYLPPKISIEGHGIKRGLTAVEAAVLLETALDRVLTMILYSAIKKGAAKVVTEDPLVVERLDAEVELRDYERDFLAAMIDKPENKRRSELQGVMIGLVKTVQKKMKGFSLRESKDYYKAIMRKAWEQIESAETPEVKSERFAEGIEWTMLDRDFDDRTKRVFRSGPVYLPPWWWYARPSTTVSRPSTASIPSSGAGRTISMPTLPGAEFAASVVTGVQGTASKLVSNVVGFTNGVTKTTNPPPPPSRTSSGRSGGGGGGCACACACAGCACACAGGGR